MKKELTEIEKKIIFHTSPEINYAFQNSVSFSQYSTWSRCPHSWLLQYAKNLAPYRATIHTLFGDSIHETIQHYLTLLYKDSATIADELDLVEYFNQRFRENYKVEFDKSKTHFSDAEEMSSFFNDAVEILNWFKENRERYFPKNKFRLLGVELPLVVQLNKVIFLKGYIDFILYDEEEDVVLIYDIKASSWGWGDKAKKDEVKIAQLLLYKEYLAKQYSLDIDKIEVQFFIVRRKIYENSMYEIPRIQIHKPASGKIKRKKVMESFNNFITECYGSDGKIIDKEYPKDPSKKNCMYCPFNNSPDLCDKKKS